MTKRILYSFALICVLAPLPTTVSAEVNAGAYLAGNSAAGENDFMAAATWFAQALSADTGNPALIENLIASRIGVGDPLGAVDVAQAARSAGIESQLGNMVLAADAAIRGDWSEIFDAHEAGHVVSPLVDGLTRGWAFVGLGRMDQALVAFDEMIETRGLRSFGLYHKALALASVGDFEAAQAILSLPPEEGLPRSRRSIIAYAQILSQLGQNDQAIALLNAAFGGNADPYLDTLSERLSGSEAIPFNMVPSAREGLAEVYNSVALVLQADTPEAYALLYARIAQTLSPRDAEVAILSATLLESLGNYDLANAAYTLVPQDDPAFHQAELGRAEVLRKDGQVDRAIEVLQQLVRAFPEYPMGFANLGDTLRRAERLPEAGEAYSKALALMPQTDPRLWFVHYMRGITNHLTDQWPAAEADFRAALARNPNQPQVLNYLGYSLVERGEKLDEALEMIERAVREEPQNGAIVDSLGWALFVLGRVEESVEPMERAAELEPVDPVVNDHLGDVYWSVGRILEARFQWNRALSFDPPPEEAVRIRRKLEIGLDAVLMEEADPSTLNMSQDL